MKQLVILSGKGGTGKTTVASSFIELSKKKYFADCDVDAPNLHLIHGVVNSKKNDYFGYEKAYKDNTACINCGKCEELCEFNAIKDGILNIYECEGCGVCEAFCPVIDKDGKKAIRLEKNISGITQVGRDVNLIFSTAELEMGNGASGKLVTEVRRNLYNEFEDIKQNNLVIIDGSPGIGCPVIASVTATDFVLVVTEPSLSGIHDMYRILETAKKFGIDTGVCINKYDTNIDNTNKITDYCKKQNVKLLGKIHYDENVIRAVNDGVSIVSYKESKAKNDIEKIWYEVKKII
jgi:MinD superfamily P-loop ATPase